MGLLRRRGDGGLLLLRRRGNGSLRRIRALPDVRVRTSRCHTHDVHRQACLGNHRRVAAGRRDGIITSRAGDASRAKNVWGVGQGAVASTLQASPSIETISSYVIDAIAHIRETINIAIAERARITTVGTGIAHVTNGPASRLRLASHVERDGDRAHGRLRGWLGHDRRRGSGTGHARSALPAE